MLGLVFRGLETSSRVFRKSGSADLCFFRRVGCLHRPGESALVCPRQAVNVLSALLDALCCYRVTFYLGLLIADF